MNVYVANTSYPGIFSMSVMSCVQLFSLDFYLFSASDHKKDAQWWYENLRAGMEGKIKQ